MGGISFHLHYLDLMQPHDSSLWNSSDRFQLLCFGVGPSLRHQGSISWQAIPRPKIKATLARATSALGARALVIGSERLLRPTILGESKKLSQTNVDARLLTPEPALMSDPYLALQAELLEALTYVVDEVFFLPLPRIRSQNSLTYLNPGVQRAKLEGAFKVEHPCTMRPVMSVDEARDAVLAALSTVEDGETFVQKRLPMQSNWATFSQHFATDQIPKGMTLERSHPPISDCPLCPADSSYKVLELFQFSGGKECIS